VVDGITGSCQGRWRRVKGLDRGREQRCIGSGEDSMMARRLHGGCDDGIGSVGEVDDYAGSREIFSRKFS
jgi:hypothetical protein